MTTRKSPLADPRWKSFRTDGGGQFQAGGFGYSFKDGDVRADMQPLSERGRPYTWRAVLWLGMDRENVVQTLGADDHWDLAELVAAAAADLQ